MIRPLPALLLMGCVMFGSVILLELDSAGSDGPAAEQAPSGTDIKLGLPRPQEMKAADLITTALAAPLFSPTRRPPETADAPDAADTGLSNVRLTGIVIGPDRRIAIFAVTGGKPLVLAEGDALRDWRLDIISAEKVSVSGPNGTRILAPKPDTTLVRPPPPTQPPAQPPSGAAAGAGGAVPGQPPALPQARAAPPAAPLPRIQLPTNAPPGSANPVRSR
jgi:hypothetical protein